MPFKNWFRRGGDPDQPVIIVSGLPRSGTSMMMQMLEAAGLPILTDNRREADASNPHGYYEYEAVKRLHRGEHAWIADAQGRVVKVISALLMHLPPGTPYRVLFMERDLAEVVRSQRSMLERLGQPTAQFDPDALYTEYEMHLRAVRRWLTTQPHIETLWVPHQQALHDPIHVATQVNTFLGGDLPVQRMAAVVDPALYRERKHD